MTLIRNILNIIPYIWIALNLHILVKSFGINQYTLFEENQYKLLEHTNKVYPFLTQDIAHYDLSEFLFYCIVPIYLYMVFRRLIASIFVAG
jgi:hypothetical protein